MQVRTELNYLRIAPRKVRLVADLIRKKKAETAQTILSFTTKKAAEPLLKLLKTATSDARHNFQLEPTNLYISKITVDEGPKYKRWIPRARGQAYEIQKRTSHITLILDEITPRKKIKRVKKPKTKEKGEKARFKPEKLKKEPTKVAPGRGTKFKPEIEKPRKYPSVEGFTKQAKPKIIKGIKRIFQRKAF